MPSIEYFPYYGPNRRSDKPVVEIVLHFTLDDQHGFPQNVSQVRDLLIKGGILSEQEEFPEQVLPEERKPWYTSLFLQTALLIQRKAGHRVSFFSFSEMANQDNCFALIEHDDCDVGMTAVKLAHELVSGQRKLLAEPFSRFKEFAYGRILPLETEAIIDAARRRDILCMRLERKPSKRENFKHLTSGDCIRRNGLLMLGHGVHQQVLDGSFCLSKSAGFKHLLNDKPKRLALLEKLAIPVIQAEESALSDSGIYILIAVNGHITALIKQSDGKSQPVADIHVSLLEQVSALQHELELAPMAISVLTTDITRPMEKNGAGILDFDLAPRLDQYLGQQAGNDPALLESTAQALIEWLFPVNSNVTMPIIAITGTNGKTTTTRMITHILQRAGRHPGMVCTDGIFLDGKKIRGGDFCSLSGHLELLTNKAEDIAVLETHHSGILSRGFAFDFCDIAVCLNVTEDHLGGGPIDTVEKMAALKRALPERARQAVVLNADDPHCLAMTGSMVAETICLVSMQHAIDELRALAGDGIACFGVLERIDTRQWMVIHDLGRRLPVMDVAAIPATFEGAAHFNISNAMHAIVATYQSGVSIEVIRTALSSFNASYESTPGRLNVFDELPFRIIMDFAHNPDGMRRLCEFVDRQNVSGRKIVAFAGMENRGVETIKNLARSAAGHFDFYFCKEYAPVREEMPDKVAHLLQQGLLESGVAIEQTEIKNYGKEVIFQILDSCEPGDLLVMLLGHVEIHQLAGYIRDYKDR